MKNYYEEKFDSLFTEFDPKKALEKIVEDLLYKSSQPKYFDYKNKFDMLMTSELKTQYDLFKNLVAIKVELINYKRNVLESFSFDSTVKYILKNESLSYLNQRNVKDNWLEKHSLLLNYWLIVGSQRLFDSDYIYRILPTGDNLEANAIALSKAFGVKEQLKQIYGICELKINNVELDLFDVMKTIYLSQAHYLKDHIQQIEEFLPRSTSHLEALSKLMMHGFMIGENRMPFTFATEQEKSKRMSSWIVEGSTNEKIKKMNQILKFWTCDLYDLNDQVTYMQKPFYRIDDFIFQFPWLTAFQNLNTAMINYVRKLHKNRLELKSETDQIELNLAEKLDKIGFQVFCQYVPSEGNAGEIDLIAMYENHVIVAEVKSTHIRSSIQEIYEYKNFVLNKASYQLDNKVEYIKRHFLSKHFGDINDVIIHSWIIDTTLEFDHEYFGDHLKVSLDEVIITSNCESEFMQKLVDEQFDIEKDEVKIGPIQFLESIEKNTFWSKQLSN